MTSDLNEQPPSDIAEALESAQIVVSCAAGPNDAGVPGIVPLGHGAGSYFFISATGEQRQFTARELVRLNLASLFGGETSWLCAAFPVRSKSGDIVFGAFNANLAAEWLMLQCSRAGLYNAETPLRRLGVWRSREDVVAHLGSTIWYRGERRPAGCLIDGAIYPACNILAEPDFDRPALAIECRELRAHLNAWSYAQEFDGDLLFGFLGAALLGGFPQWRVHCIVTGERGTGKSTIGRFLMDAIGAQGTSLNEYTEAGVRQKLTDQSRTTHLDEGESAGGEMAHRMAKVVALLRKMSDGAGARIVRGTSGGQALNSTVTGCVLLTAINAPPLQPQDRSRILTVPLDKLRHGTSEGDVRVFRREAAALSPRLRARALIGARRFDVTFSLYRQCLQAHGCDPRQADLFSTLLAGRSLLIDDAIPERAEAERYVALLRKRLHLIMVDDSEEGDGQSCLNRLLDAESPAIRDGIKKSIGQLVSDAMKPGSSAENEKLIPIGVRIMDVRNTNQRALFIANDHLGLKRIFHNTPWAEGNWRASLKRLPGVSVAPAPVSVGRKSRGLLIPRELLPGGDDHGEVDWPSPDNPSPPIPAPVHA